MYVCGLVIPRTRGPGGRLSGVGRKTRAKVFKDYGCLEIVESPGRTSFPTASRRISARRSRQSPARKTRLHLAGLARQRRASRPPEAKMHEDERQLDGSGEPPFDAKRLILGCFQLGLFRWAGTDLSGTNPGGRTAQSRPQAADELDQGRPRRTARQHRVGAQEFERARLGQERGHLVDGAAGRVDLAEHLGDRRLQGRGDPRQHGGRDAIGAALIFLDLLEGPRLAAFGASACWDNPAPCATAGSSPRRRYLSDRRAPQVCGPWCSKNLLGGLSWWSWRGRRSAGPTSGWARPWSVIRIAGLGDGDLPPRAEAGPWQKPPPLKRHRTPPPPGRQDLHQILSERLGSADIPLTHLSFP